VRLLAADSRVTAAPSVGCIPHVADAASVGKPESASPRSRERPTQTPPGRPNQARMETASLETTIRNQNQKTADDAGQGNESRIECRA